LAHFKFHFGIITLIKKEFNGLSVEIKGLFDERHQEFVQKENYKKKREEARNANRLQEKEDYSRKVKRCNAVIKNLNQTLASKLDKNIKTLEAKMNGMIAHLFGSTQEQGKRMPMSIEANNIAIYDTKRFHLEVGSETISQVREAIEADVRTMFSLVFDTRNEMYALENEYLKTVLASENPKNTLFAVLNRFAQANIAHEIKHCKGKQGYIDFLKERQQTIDGQNEKAYLRIGAGKTYFWNSIGLAIRNADTACFEYLREIVELYPIQKKFPVTISLTMDKSLPLGWIELSEANKQTFPASTKSITEKALEAKPVYFEGKLKQGAKVNAQVIVSGKPNKVKLFLQNGNEPQFELKGINNEVPLGSILIVKIGQMNNKGDILQISFDSFKT
jgi:hypothetical protein